MQRITYVNTYGERLVFGGEPPLLLREEDGRESEESLALSHWKER